jgi:hypothetical protein
MQHLTSWQIGFSSIACRRQRSRPPPMFDCNVYPFDDRSVQLDGNQWRGTRCGFVYRKSHFQVDDWGFLTSRLVDNYEISIPCWALCPVLFIFPTFVFFRWLATHRLYSGRGFIPNIPASKRTS